jgi:hypothetical protein
VALDRKHKAFRFAKAMPIDANNVIFEQAFARFLVLVRTKGIPITQTTKDTLHPEDLVHLIAEDNEYFQGIDNDPQRRRLLEHWIANDFTTCVKEGRGHTGESRIANLKPIHMSTIKLLDPRIRSQDRDASVFLYNVFRDSMIFADQQTLLPFLTWGTKDFGEHDLVVHEPETKDLDIETLFLLRMLSQFHMDRPNRNKRVQPHEFICEAQRQLIINDTLRLLVYKDSIPRRELIRYLMTLLSFHCALYCIKSFSIVNGIMEKRKVGCRYCRAIKPNALNDLCKCEHHPGIFVDLTNGQDSVCDALAKEKLAQHYAAMYRYFRSHYMLKKLDEFANTFPGYDGSFGDLIKFMDHKHLEGYFRVKLGEVTSVDEGEEQDPEIKDIVELGLPPFDTYIEILTQKTFKTRSRNHKSLMASLCGLNREGGFLHGGRGKKRKYVLGNELLELLVQLAVVSAKRGRFITQPITITEFVIWLRERYGILIDTIGEPVDSPEVTQGLENNYNALKDRLRQLGFFTDLSDASISQVIRPRFPIETN